MQVRGAPPDVLPSPPALCLASVATARCRCKTAPGSCLPPLPHTLALRSKIILTSLVHVFAPHLVSICRQLARRPVSSPFAPRVPRPPLSRRRSPPFMHNTLAFLKTRLRTNAFDRRHRQDGIYHQDHRSQPGSSPRACPRRTKVLPRRHIRSLTT